MTLANYPSDVTDAEWAFVAPYLCLMRLDAPQRDHDLRQVFNGLRYLVRTGAPWRYLPTNFPPWAAVYQQTQRWLRAGCFEQIVHDLRELLRTAAGRNAQPSAAIFDGRTLQSSPESGARGGYDGHKRKKGSKVHLAVDTLGHLLALLVTPANAQERAQVAQLAQAVQATTGQSVEVAFVDQGYTGPEPAQAAQAQGIRLDVVQLPEAKRASSCCRAAGWWSAVLPGQRGSAAWLATMNGCRKHSLACISWCLPVSCSLKQHPCCIVHNTL